MHEEKIYLCVGHLDYEKNTPFLKHRENIDLLVKQTR